MAIGPTTTGRSGSDSSWMGSRHAVAEAHPGTLSASDFASADGVTNGVVPSGYPVAEDSGKLVPYDPGDGGENPGNTLYGFVIDDRDISGGDEPCAVLWHGRVRVANLPVTFTPPADATAFVWA